MRPNSTVFPTCRNACSFLAVILVTAGVFSCAGTNSAVARPVAVLPDSLRNLCIERRIVFLSEMIGNLASDIDARADIPGVQVLPDSTLYPVLAQRILEIDSETGGLFLDQPARMKGYREVLFDDPDSLWEAWNPLLQTGGVEIVLFRKTPYGYDCHVTLDPDKHMEIHETISARRPGELFFLLPETDRERLTWAATIAELRALRQTLGSLPNETETRDALVRIDRLTEKLERRMDPQTLGILYRIVFIKSRLLG